MDPEIPELTIEELGILRDVSEEGAVTITPTYSGCPAMDLIRGQILDALHRAGYREASVRTQLRPAWSTDMISESGRAKLAAAGIAPPWRAQPEPGFGGGEHAQHAHGPTRPVPVVLSPRCPRCGAHDTEQLSRFGPAPCKALWRCRSCREPFEGIKAL